MSAFEDYIKKLEENRPLFQKVCSLSNLDIIELCEQVIQDHASIHYLLDTERCQGQYRNFNVRYEKDTNIDWYPSEIEYKISYYDSLWLTISGAYVILREQMEHCDKREIMRMDFHRFYDLYVTNKIKNNVQA